MNQRKLAFSIALGAVLTVALLVGFSLSRNTAVAAPQARELIDQGRAAAAVRAQDEGRTAYIVVRFDDSNTIVRSIAFTEPITAYTALREAGLDVDVIDMGWGLLLCGIEGVGTSLPDGSACDNGTRYWSTSYWSEGDWAGRMVGIDSAVISETEHVEGFSFSDPDWVAINPPPAPQLTAAAHALNWLRAQQRSDGSFGSVNDTVETLMAVSANGIDASGWRHSPSLLANVLSTGPEFANRNAAGSGKLAVALAAQESCWPIGAEKPLDHYDAASGTFSPDTLYQGWGILGTTALGESVPVSAVVSLKEHQQENGGWELFAGFGADTNATALALQALIAAGEPVTSTSVVSGLAYLEDAQNDDGGFPYSPDSPWSTESDTNSTTYVLQALLAVGEDPLTGKWAAANGDPISYLLSMQLPDGSFEWQAGSGSNQLATQQVIPALMHRSFPMTVAALDACYGISGQVVSRIAGSENPMADVHMEADGAEDLFFALTDASGTYTVSVPSTTTYLVTPSRDGFAFAPTTRSAVVSGAPGDVTWLPEFVGQARIYLPLVMRD